MTHGPLQVRRPQVDGVLCRRARSSFLRGDGYHGHFSIEGLPKGDDVVEAWHEKYGTKQANLSVGADRAALDFEFSE